MKAIMKSVSPIECERIASGEQTILVCKTRPKIDTPFKSYIYQKERAKKKFLDHRFNSFFAEKSHYRDMGKVIGEFVCDRIDNILVGDRDGTNPPLEEVLEKSCLSYDELCKYGNYKDIYGLHISDLKIYDKPKELGEFSKPCDWNYDCCTCKRAKYELTKAETKLFYGCDMELTRPPQNWCYVEEL